MMSTGSKIHRYCSHSSIIHYLNLALHLYAIWACDLNLSAMNDKHSFATWPSMTDINTSTELD